MGKKRNIGEELEQGMKSAIDYMRGKKEGSVTTKLMVPTNEQAEKEKVRVAIWLDKEDLDWLSKHCCCPEDAAQTEKERCMRIRFRSSTALHKAGLKE